MFRHPSLAPVSDIGDLQDRRRSACYGFVDVSSKLDSTDRSHSAGDSLKVVSTMSAGYDHIVVDSLRQRRVRLGTSEDFIRFCYSRAEKRRLTCCTDQRQMH